MLVVGAMCWQLDNKMRVVQGRMDKPCSQQLSLFVRRRCANEMLILALFETAGMDVIFAIAVCAAAREAKNSTRYLRMRVHDAAENIFGDRLVTMRCAFACGEHKRAFQLTRAVPFPTDRQKVSNKEHAGSRITK